MANHDFPITKVAICMKFLCVHTISEDCHYGSNDASGLHLLGLLMATSGLALITGVIRLTAGTPSNSL